MRLRSYWIIFLVTIFLVFPTINAEITGKASSQPMDVSLTILLPAPIIDIIYPENKTYITNLNLPFIYTSNYEDNEWYNIDDVTNITLSGNTFFNTTEGLHTINLYGNNSVGISRENVTFSINLTILKIYYGEYSGFYAGDSTNFNYTAYEDLQNNLSDVVLEHDLWGKIEFLGNISIVNDSDPDDGIVDLDQYTHISLNRIEVNSTYLPNLNQPATLTLRNIPFSDPVLLRNGEACPSSICTLVSFAGGTMIFNVTELSGVYSTEQVSNATTVTTVISTGGGGGGGRTIIEGVQKNFEIDKGTILVPLKQGDTLTEKVTVTNTGREKLTINVRSAGDIEDMVVISPLSFELSPQESKEVELLFFARSGFGLYSGKIFFEDQDGAQDYLSVLLDVESKQALLDLYLDILEDPAVFSPGEEIVAEIYAFNIVNRETEIELSYSIVNENGDVLFEESEKMKITNFINTTKRITLPDGFPKGNYVLRVTSSYQGKTASSSELFIVSTGLGRFFSGIFDKALKNKTYLGLFLLLLLLLILFFIYRRRKEKAERYLSPLGIACKDC